MKTLRRMIFRDVITTVAFVTLAFLALFFFFDLLDEMRYVGRSESYTTGYAMLVVLLEVPNHLYELLPITVLIGTIYVMARLAESSEFTIMRTSGLGPWLALRTLLTVGAGFVLLTFVVGDYIAPMSERAATAAQAKFMGKTVTTGSTGAWLKERQNGNTLAINVRNIRGDELLNLRIFEFDREGRMRRQIHAAKGLAVDGTHWQLEQVQRSEFHYPDATEAKVERFNEPTYNFATELTPDMVAAAVHKPDRMPTIELFQFIQHLENNDQSAQKYEIEFWRKVFYPLSCLVMVVLALPFAYLHFRSGGIAGYVFGGVMAGISFFLLNNVFGYAGNLNNWQPMLTAAAPGVIYSLLSLGAFAWLVLRR
ncbi:MAG: LPS export ABC transporter permease LptG [Acidovorax sp.]|jgi:lipopolysaccharide export system permease protein|nr:LPS export ABC transporter permease LptG [Acidovorax sp.]